MNPITLSSLITGGRHETNTETETVSGTRVARGRPSQASSPPATRQFRSDQRHQRIDAESPEASHSRHAGHRDQIATP